MPLFTPPHLLNGHRWRGMRVGLLGGSFNPPHEGHLHISEIAMRRLKLDCVWWMVTPQNPLKDSRETLDYADRMELCRRMVRTRSFIVISDIEKQMGTARTVETLGRLKRAFPGTEFILLAGTDIMFQLHRWYRWREIPHLARIVFIGRPPAAGLIRNSPARQALGRKGRLIVSTPLHPASSSEIRKSWR